MELLFVVTVGALGVAVSACALFHWVVEALEAGRDTVDPERAAREALWDQLEAER